MLPLGTWAIEKVKKISFKYLSVDVSVLVYAPVTEYKRYLKDKVW